MSLLPPTGMSPEPALERVPCSISVLIDSAVATFDADRDTARRYLQRASAILRAQGEVRATTGQEVQTSGGFATWQVNRIVDYVEQHMAEKITGRDLAKLLNISLGQLFRAFKVSVGVAPFQYIQRRRIEFACTMLRTTREPLAQVAVASGLCDQSHLCRVFRRVIGITPAMWRRINARDPGPREERASIATSPFNQDVRAARRLDASRVSQAPRRIEL